MFCKVGAASSKNLKHPCYVTCFPLLETHHQALSETFLGP